MNIKKQLNGTELTLSLSGALDTENAPKLEEVMNESLTGVTSLIIDLKDLNYISSSGLRLLLALRKQVATDGGKLQIRNISNDIRQVFMMTGFISLFEIV